MDFKAMVEYLEAHQEGPPWPEVVTFSSLNKTKTLYPTVFAQVTKMLDAELGGLDTNRIDGATVQANLRAALPALDQEMEHPEGAQGWRLVDGALGYTNRVPSPWTLRTIIVDLNDRAKWTREQIADWLDTLDLDLQFPTPTGEAT